MLYLLPAPRSWRRTDESSTRWWHHGRRAARTGSWQAGTRSGTCSASPCCRCSSSGSSTARSGSPCPATRRLGASTGSSTRASTSTRSTGRGIGTLVRYSNALILLLLLLCLRKIYLSIFMNMLALNLIVTRYSPLASYNLFWDIYRKLNALLTGYLKPWI